MRLSTAGRYALRAMVDLAQRDSQEPIQRVSIAERQGISDQYLAQLFVKLRRAGLVESTRGPGGGYALAQSPAQITAGDVLRAVEEEVDPVPCASDEDRFHCDRLDVCPTHWLWAKLGGAITSVLDSVTLLDLCEQATFGEENR